MFSPRSRPGKVISVLLVLITLNSTVGCYYYTYQVDSAPSMVKIDQLKNSPNYLIIHQQENAFNLYDVKIDEQAQTISGLLRALPVDHLNYLKTKPEPGSANVYKKKSKDLSKNTPAVVDEVHFYVKDISLREGETITVPLSAIEKIEVYDPDTGATTAAHILEG